MLQNTYNFNPERATAKPSESLELLPLPQAEAVLALRKKLESDLAGNEKAFLEPIEPGRPLAHAQPDAQPAPAPAQAVDPMAYWMFFFKYMLAPLTAIYVGFEVIQAVLPTLIDGSIYAAQVGMEVVIFIFTCAAYALGGFGLLFLLWQLLKMAFSGQQKQEYPEFEKRPAQAGNKTGGQRGRRFSHTFEEEEY